MIRGYLILIFLPLCYGIGRAQQYQLASPDAQLWVEIENSSKGIGLKMTKGADLILTLSNLGITADQLATDALRINKVTRNTVDEVVRPVVREKSETYQNTYNELVLTFRSNQSLTFRLFNEGLAYRFSTTAKDSLTIVRETLNRLFQEGDSVRFQS